jgi:hypothetical protein
VITMNKIFKLHVGNRDFFGFYLDDKNVLFVREGLGCFFFLFYYRFGHFVKFPLFRLVYNLSESAIEMRYGLDDDDNVLDLEKGILGSVN